MTQDKTKNRVNVCSVNEYRIIEDRSLLLYVNQYSHVRARTRTHTPSALILRELNEIMKNEFCIFNDWLLKVAVLLERREETQVPDRYTEAEDFSHRAESLHLYSTACNSG